MTTKTPAVESMQSTPEPHPAMFAVPTTGLLAMPIPDGCSDLYAAGWAWADALVVRGGDMTTEAEAHWDDERIQGYLDRLKAEHDRLNASAPPSVR
uniref:Uncharacterized protein n=1 Tax=Pseudomonas fluorescens (strain SBW25) TaxID=216595 RepID=A0A0G4E5K2_PSEFS|nr:hypothetical protein [Pseudomonas fluorescens]CEK42303.1 hypothetical protein PQBR57_0350 [Pseudomonas fluorescens SBW25]